MSQLDNIVNVTITTTPAPISATNYGVPLILGSTTPGWSDVAHTYTDPSGMLTDGYTLTSPEYLSALALYSSDITPTQFLVAPRRSSNSTQIDTFSISGDTGAALTTGTTYAFTVDGTVITYTTLSGDTAQTVLGSFVTQLNAKGGFTPVISNSGSSKLLTVTAASAGVAHVYTAISANLVHLSPAQAGGIGNDLAAVTPLSSSWYCLLTPGVSTADALLAAAYIETAKKLYVVTSAAPGNFDPSSTTSLAYKVHQLGYRRTSVLPSLANLYIDAAWVGSNLPTSPGSSNWAFSALPGQQADALTDTQIAAAYAASANVFINVSGANVTLYGTTGSGDYIDNIIFQDWLHSAIQNNVFNILRNAAANGGKIPYTNKGASRIGQGVYAAIQQGIVNGGIDGDQPFSVNITKVEDTPAANRANRQCPPITFECVLAGAIDNVVINGTLDI